MKYGYRIRRISLVSCCLLFFARVAFAQGNDSIKKEIYAQLTACGVLNAFEKAACPEAFQMRGYIDALLESGVQKDEILYKLVKKFTLNVIADRQVKETMEKRLGDELGKDRPQLFLEVDAFDFGEVSKKQGTVKKNITLYNKGNSDLVIKNLKAFCSCTTIALSVGKEKSTYFGREGAAAGWQMVIKPQKTGLLEIVLDVSDSTMPIGKISRAINIFTNDPIYPERPVRFEAKVIE
jgi:hypothetical protein